MTHSERLDRHEGAQNCALCRSNPIGRNAVKPLEIHEDVRPIESLTRRVSIGTEQSMSTG